MVPEPGVFILMMLALFVLAGNLTLRPRRI
ncbi:PEP-CTERM sorting domain-containing protein [Thalassomonas viridans]|uniref:PEP-CTERM sorting domain-containing protein n=1 Tax=Thalassomonas viridans TaxID=137584 RepID=A0AAE9Z8M5_9GAMM|nr:PEP-CTERM sorting domain-containing protein [Thalassomonas viridans]